MLRAYMLTLPVGISFPSGQVAYDTLSPAISNSPVMDGVCFQGRGKGHRSRRAEVAMPTRQAHLPRLGPMPP